MQSALSVFSLISLCSTQNREPKLTSRGCHVFRVFKLPDFWGTEPERWAQKERSSNVRYFQGNTRASCQVQSRLSEKCQACFPDWPDFSRDLLHVCVCVVWPCVQRALSQRLLHLCWLESQRPWNHILRECGGLHQPQLMLEVDHSAGSGDRLAAATLPADVQGQHPHRA